MSDYKQEILFPNSGLNSDDSNLFAGLGDAPFRMHIMIGEEGQNGVVTNMKGNHLARYTFNYANVHQVVGSYYNRLTRKCYYWVFSQPYDYTTSDDYIYDNHLLCFDEDTETITNIFTDEFNYFGLDINYPVKDCDMLGDYLYFNPRISEPKMIDVVRAKNYMDYDDYDPLEDYLYGNKVKFFGGIFLANVAVTGESPSESPTKWERIGDCYQDYTDITPDFDSEFRYAFNVIRHVPVARPVFVYGTDADKNANNVRGKVFRFTHRYKFFDNTYSKFSAFSNITLPLYDEYYNGEVPGDVDVYNYIAVTIRLHSSALIKEIEIGFQETGGKWYKAKIVNRWEQEMLDDLTYTYKFYNTDSAYEIIPDELFEEPYDSVPRWAATQELINKNILAYGGCTLGFNNIDRDEIDITLTPEIEALTIPNSEMIGGRMRDNIGDLNNPTDFVFVYEDQSLYLNFGTWYPTFGMAAGDIYIIKIDDGEYSYTVQPADIFNIDTFMFAIEAFIESRFPNITIATHIAPIKRLRFVITSTFRIHRSVFYQPSATARVALTKAYGFKTGSWQPMCIYYYDGAMRRCDAQTSKENVNLTGYSINGSSVYVPMFNEYGELITNGHFYDGEDDWVLGSANWSFTIATHVMTRVANADGSTLSQNTACVSGTTYRVVYTLTRTTGTITPSLGGTNLTPRAIAGTYTEDIVCGAVANAPMVFTPDATFAGTVDIVSIKAPMTTANRWKINWEVNHLPPSYAKWWRWGYAGNALCSYFVQYIIEAIEDSAPWVRMDIAPLQTLKSPTDAAWNEFPQSAIEPYAFAKGDRVRIITEDENSNNLGDVYNGVLDYEIVKYEEADTGEYWIYTQDFDITGLGAGTLIEIYRPLKRDTAKVFYEFGELMPIIEDSDGMLVHGCGTVGTQDQDTALVLPATGVFEAGDVYHILRTPSLPIDTIEGYFHESQWYSDFYISDDWDKGRIGFETSFKQQTLNIIQYSNQYLQNTQINGLSTFEADNYKELNDIYGTVQSMVEMGNTLKVYMQKKSASINIGRAEYQDTDGKLTTASSEVILGSIRYPENNFGTQWLESISKNNKFVYGFDVFNGVMWRDSSNGIYPISGRFEDAYGNGDYKMETWFRDKSEALTTSGIEYVKVMTVWDERYKCLYVIFRDIVNSANNDTIVFHEPSNRWITLAEFEQTPEEGYNIMLELDYWVLTGFESGIGYSFDEDTRFAVFNIPNTGKSIRTFPDPIEITLELLEPTITCSCDAVADMQEIHLTPLAPTILITYVFVLGGNDLIYTYYEHGDSAKQLKIIKFSPTAKISSMVYSVSGDDWLVIKNSVGDTVGIDSSLLEDSANTSNLWFYPSSVNSGAERTCVITFANDYNDSDDLTVYQNETVVALTINISVSILDEKLTISGASGTLVGFTVSVTFTPSHPDYDPGDIYDLNWEAYTDEGRVGMGTIEDVVDGAVKNTDLVLPDYSSSSRTIWITLDSDTQSNVIVSETLQEITLSLLTPTVLITRIVPIVDLMAWTAIQSGLGDATATVVLTGDADAYITAKPYWISIQDSLGNNLDVGSPYTIGNGDTIYVFPTQDNPSFELTGDVVLGNDYGDTATIIVVQQTAIPPIGVVLTASIEVNTDVDTTGMTITGDSVYAVSGSTSVQITFTPDHPLYGIGDPPYTIYYMAYINGVLDKSGNFASIMEEWDNLLTIVLNTPPIVGDVITIEISSLSF